MIGLRKFRTREGRRKERIRLALVATGCTVGIILACYGLGVLFREPFMRLDEVAVVTDGELSEEEIVALVRTSLGGTWLWLMPEDSLVLMRTSAIETLIASSYPRVRAVNVARHDVRDLMITIEERSPSALFCGDVVPLIAYTDVLTDTEDIKDAWGTCYLMDSDSFIYAHAPGYSEAVLPRFYGPLEHAVPIGQTFLGIDEFSRLLDLFDRMATDQPIRALLIVDEHDLEVYLKDGTRVLSPRDLAPEVLEKRLVATVHSGVIDKVREVEYLDLRFHPKVFVKYVATDEASTTDQIEVVTTPDE